MKSILLALLSALALISCGKTKDVHSSAPDITLCDPEVNASACPTTLRADGVYRYDLTRGDEGIGFEVENPSEEKIMDTCRQAKAALLEAYLEPNNPHKYKGLNPGEYIDGTSYTIMSEGEICTQRNTTKSCTRHMDFVRVSCVYKVFFNAALIPTKKD